MALEEIGRPDRARIGRIRGLPLSGSAAIWLILSQPTFAQSVPQSRPPERAPASISLDRPVEGSLGADDPMVGDGAFDGYQVRLELGQNVQVDMASDDFDPYLDVISPGLTEPLLGDDDGGGTLNARLRFPAPVAGDYIVRARSLNGGVGEYSLTVKTARPPAEPPTPTPIRAGGEVSGILSESSARSEDGSPYDLYRFSASAPGTRIQVDMEAASGNPESTSMLDPRLSIRAARPSGAEPFSATDDDGGGGTDARILAVLPQAGDYLISAQGWPDNVGGYRLRVRQVLVSQQPPAPSPIAAGAPVDGVLAFDDPDLQIGSDDGGSASYLYKLYGYPAQSGQQIVVDLKSADFDTVLDAGVMSPIGFALARSNDDFEGTDARLVLTPESDGMIYFRARSLGTELGNGGYTLSVSPAAR